MNYYNINTALFNYVSLRASSTVAFHPTVETVGFPGLHFVTASGTAMFVIFTPHPTRVIAIAAAATTAKMIVLRFISRTPKIAVGHPTAICISQFYSNEEMSAQCSCPFFVSTTVISRS